MTRKTLFLDDRLYEYMLAKSVSQSPIQRSLSEATAAMERAGSESSPEQVQFLQLLVRLIGAKRCLEVGVFTGYSTLSIAQALPPDGSIVACDIDGTATAVAREYWERAGVASKIDLRLAPAIETLDALLAEGLAGRFDFAYIDADKGNSDAYYERVLKLLGENRLMAIDNVFWGGSVAERAADDWHTRSIKALNIKMGCDNRVDVSIVPIGDGVALARKRSGRDRLEGRVANATAWKHDPTEIPIASPDLCAAACRAIYEQRPRWRARLLNGQPPFYTLGAASYLDLGFEGRSIDGYLEDAGSLWRWAGDAVLTVVERVRARLADYLGQPVEYAPILPSPGFHIFIGRAIPKSDCARQREDCGSCHFDTQHSLIPWDRWYTRIDLQDTFSFTLPLKLPVEGGGLTFWESLSVDRMRACINTNRFGEIVAAAHATPSATIRYTAGRLVLHNGHMLHQMAGVPKISVTDERITLQGHGILADGVWRLYW